jgi:hypothetical protein
MECLQLEGTLGFGDPAKTGQWIGALNTLDRLNSQAISIAVSPDFIGKRVEGEMTLVIRFVFIRVFVGLVYYIFILFHSYLKCRKRMKRSQSW